MEKGTMGFNDPQLVNKIVEEYMSQGHFDQMRRRLMSDLDTKPSYQNVRQRIESTVQGFLVKQSWRPNLVKNQLRDALKRQIINAPFLRPGVRRIVDQLVSPSSLMELRPQLEDIAKLLSGVEDAPTSSQAPCDEPMDVAEDHANAADSEEESQMVVAEEDAVAEKSQDEGESTNEGNLVQAMEHLAIPQSAIENNKNEESLEESSVPEGVLEQPEVMPVDETPSQQVDELPFDPDEDSDHSIMNKMSPITVGTPSPPPSPSALTQTGLTPTKRASDFIGKIPKLKKNATEDNVEDDNISQATSTNSKGDDREGRSERKNDRSSSNDKYTDRSKDKSSRSSREKERHGEGDRSTSSDDRRKDHVRSSDKSYDRDRNKDRSSTRDKERDRSRGNEKSRDKEKERSGEKYRKDSRDKTRDSHSGRDRDRKPSDKHRDKYDDEKDRRRKETTRDRDRKDSDRDRHRKQFDKDRPRKESDKSGDRKDRRDNRNDRDKESNNSYEKDEVAIGKDENQTKMAEEKTSMEVSNVEPVEASNDTNRNENDDAKLRSESLVKDVTDRAPETLPRKSNRKSVENPKFQEFKSNIRKRARKISVDNRSEKGSSVMETCHENYVLGRKASNDNVGFNEVTNNDDSSLQSQPDTTATHSSSESVKTADDASRDSQDSISSKDREQLPPKYKIGTVSPILTRSKGRKPAPEKVTESLKKGKRTGKRNVK